MSVESPKRSWRTAQARSTISVIPSWPSTAASSSASSKLINDGIGCERYEPRRTLPQASVRRVRERLPEVDAGEASVGTPRLCELSQLGRRRRRLEPVGPHRPVADPQVARREEVRALQEEDEEHVRAPHAEPPCGRDLGDRLVVIELVQAVEL